MTIIVGVILTIIIGGQGAFGAFTNYLPFKFQPQYFEYTSPRPLQYDEQTGMAKFFNVYRFKKNFIYPENRGISVPAFFIVHRKRNKNYMAAKLKEHTVQKDQAIKKGSVFWSNPYFLLHP